jgi:hypothetical protein
MERVIKQIGILIVVLTTLCACTNEPIEQEVSMLKRIVEVSVDGSSSKTTLHYNGIKIASIDKGDAVLEFFYTGSLITKIIETNKETSHINTLDYYYVEGILSKITSSDNYVVSYTHNKDGSVSYEKWTKSANNTAVKEYYGTLFFDNENLVKEERVNEDSQKGLLTTKTLNRFFDNRNNALRHILGFDKLLDFAKTASSNNCILHSESYSEKHLDTDQIISSIKRVDNKIKYNATGYPIEIISENRVFGDSDSKHLKSQLFYN